MLAADAPLPRLRVDAGSDDSGDDSGGEQAVSRRGNHS